MKSSFLKSSLDNLFLFVMILVGIKEAIVSSSDDITEWDRRAVTHNAHHNLNACILMVEKVPFLSLRNGSLNSE